MITSFQCLNLQEAITLGNLVNILYQLSKFKILSFATYLILFRYLNYQLSCGPLKSGIMPQRETVHAKRQEGPLALDLSPKSLSGQDVFLNP